MDITLALIGFGEAGSTFARAASWGGSARAWDVNPDRREAMTATDVTACASAAEALAGVPLVLSLVTADEAIRAARDYAPLLASGAIWCDMNSVAPQSKREAANVIEAAGGRYADVAVLAPVEPARMAVPLMVSGVCADEAAAKLREAGFGNVRTVGAEVGRASSIKMIRSVMIKGIEALTDEMMAAAEAAGVSREVLASLDASERPRAWSERAAYNIERMATHGARRAAEMEEAARTLASLGVEPVMTAATIRRQRAAASKGTGK
jgi:3-hydroxyisobutyrate dehydrogenase-like beta-hydroxyacid dehydrogenase